jgi:hypothetical protein
MRALMLALILFSATARAQSFDKAFAPDPHAKPPRLDWKFVGLVSADSALMLWDETQTAHCLSHIPGCSETNGIYGPHPSPGRLYGTAIAYEVGLAVASYEIRRHGPRFLRKSWFTPMAWDIEQHAIGIATSVH